MEDRRGHTTAGRLLTQAGLTLAAVGLVSLTSSAPALAGPPADGSCSGAGKWVVCEADQDTAKPGSGSAAADSDNENSGSKPVCTVTKMDPQPPIGSAFGGDRKPGEVAYIRTCKNGPDGAPITSVIVADEGADVPAVDPVVVAHQAVNKMKLSGPDIASPRPAGTYVVGVPMWLWVNPSPTTFGPNTTSASAGGVTVTATAKVTQIVWAMGDGTSVTCNGAGTKYVASYGKQESPTCGHAYSRTSASQAQGEYSVTATATWSVNWQVNGDGETGQFTEIRQTNVQVPIGELQVVR